MKITKLSLVAIAAMTLTTGAMAEITTELSGNAKIWYETADSDGGVDGGLFHKASTNGFSAGDAAVSVEAKGTAGAFGYGLKYTVVDTLGLENNLVSTRRQPATGSTAAEQLKTAHWAEKAFITYQMGNTTAKIGRQHLNTPLAFTEKWNISANSFDAAVLINSDIENVTLIGAYVGKGNGAAAVPGLVGFSTVAPGGEFTSYVDSGAYAFGALVKPSKELGINAWYYNVQNIADAAWLDANYAVSGVNLGAIYAQMMPKGALNGNDDTSAFALKAASKVGPVSLLAAYSSVSEDGILPVGNTATGFKKTKLPTAGIYNDGVIVAAPGANTFKIKAAMPVGPVKLTAQYISTTNDNDDGTVRPVTAFGGAFGKEVDEIDLVAATKVADVNLKAIFMNRTFGTNANDGRVVFSDTNHIRIIAGIDF